MIELKTRVDIDGKQISAYSSIVLKQPLQDHHNFEVAIPHEAIESYGTHTIDASREWLGKVLLISNDYQSFVGIITRIKLVNKDGFHGRLVVSGSSKSILLESGKHYNSWVDQPLSSIVQKLTTPLDKEMVIKPVENLKVPYEMQYEESNFQYLRRLAEKYNEWCYYDGVRLFFGKPRLQDPINIAYGEGVSELSIGMQTEATMASLYQYEVATDKQLVSLSKEEVAGLNELGTHAFQTSNKLFNERWHQYSKTPALSKYELDQRALKEQAAKVASMHMVQGKSSDGRLKLGGSIRISSSRYTEKGFEERSYGAYIITKITHYMGESGEYHNDFEAIPEGMKIAPLSTDISYPQPTPQLATVTSNEDPDGKGRVKVQFQWQQYQDATSWIRVLTPDGGSSELAPTNRGYVFIPEVGDQVMIGFEYGDPCRPFILGSVFHGKNGVGGQEKNAQKSIVTRGGHTIAFDDTDNKESITITDKNNNSIFINTHQNEMTITAGETLTLAAKNIVLQAEENVDITAQKQLTAAAQEDLQLLSEQNIKLQSSEDTQLKSGGNLGLEASSDLTAKGSNAIIEGSSKAELNGGNTKVSGKSMAEFTGATVKIN